jgi:lipopolysaccharide export LptBFGC system permease protein LptF
LKDENDEREDDLSDDIKREDGLVRYWMFFNGDQVRLFSALVAAFLGVLWCFLYVLGAGRTVLGTVLLVLALISFWVWRVFDRQIREYEESGWKKDKHPSERDKIEIQVALFLWLFIFIVVGFILLLQWRRGH